MKYKVKIAEVNKSINLKQSKISLHFTKLNFHKYSIFMFKTSAHIDLFVF